MKKNNNVVNELSDAAKVSMRTRIIAGIVGIIIVAPCLILGDWLMLALMIFVLVASIYEVVSCSAVKQKWIIFITSSIFALLLMLWPLLSDLVGGRIDNSWRLFNSFDEVFVSPIVIALMLLGETILLILDKDFSIREGFFIFTMIIMLSLGYQSMLVLRYLPSSITPFVDRSTYINKFDNYSSITLILFVIIGTCFTDIGAYFIGVFFGKHKMIERISPKKTWEGFFGGVIISALCSFLFAFIMAKCGKPIIPLFDGEHWYLILLLSLTIPLISVIGDLYFSLIKRLYNIKDYSHLIPGHGGILDRTDSLIFSSILSAVVTLLMLYF